MEKLIKKLLCIVLSLVLVIALCGCADINITVGSNKTSDSSDSTPSSQSSSVDNAGGYKYICINKDSDKPVEGVTVQLCTDSNCYQKKSDSEGIVIFDVPLGSWEVHIAKVPEGYELPSESNFLTNEETTTKTIYISSSASSSNS